MAIEKQWLDSPVGRCIVALKKRLLEDPLDLRKELGALNRESFENKDPNAFDVFGELECLWSDMTRVHCMEISDKDDWEDFIQAAARLKVMCNVLRPELCTWIVERAEKSPLVFQYLLLLNYQRSLLEALAREAEERIHKEPNVLE